jgi:ATP-dependent DNA helicase PIF1
LFFIQGKVASDDCFGGLKKSFYLCNNAEIVFTSNIWTPKGIVNGAFGIVRDIIYPINWTNDSLPQVIFVEIKV